MSSLFVPLAGDATLSNGDVVTFAGEVHVLAQVVFSDTGVPSVSLYVNLARVQGMGTSGMDYLLVGAASTDWVGGNPGPPDIPGLSFDFTLVSLATPPSRIHPPNPNVPVFLRNFTFCQESVCLGTLLSVDAELR